MPIIIPEQIDFSDYIEAISNGGLDKINQEIRIGDRVLKLEAIKVNPPVTSIERFDSIGATLEDLETEIENLAG